jgi:hypothetical protein
VIALMTGAFLSTSKGPNAPVGGCGNEVFPATSFTVTAGMVTLLVSVPTGTFVDTEKDDGPARPEPLALSLALHVTTASVACHTIAGCVQVTAGGVKSILIVKVGVELSTLLPLLVTTVSMTFELSVAA